MKTFLLGIMLAGCSSANFSGSDSKKAPTAKKKESPPVEAEAEPVLAKDEPVEAPVEKPEKPVVSAEQPSPAPDRAISKGSFSIWFEPGVCSANQNDRLFVRVKLPPGMQQYPQSDLSGTIVGSDGYEQSITDSNTWAGHEQPTFEITGGYATYSVWTPCPEEEGGQDDIVVSSAILKETQTLHMED